MLLHKRKKPAESAGFWFSFVYLGSDVIYDIDPLL